MLANLSMLVLYGMCCLATWQLRRRDVRGGGALQGPRANLVVVLVCLVIGWMLTSITRAEWIAFGISLAAASAIFAVRRGPVTL